MKEIIETLEEKTLALEFDITQLKIYMLRAALDGAKEDFEKFYEGSRKNLAAYTMLTATLSAMKKLQKAAATDDDLTMESKKAKKVIIEITPEWTAKIKNAGEILREQINKDIVEALQNAFTIEYYEDMNHQDTKNTKEEK